MHPQADETVLALIDSIGRSRMPREACGLLLPVPDRLDRRVIELPNRSVGRGEYEIWSEDAALELRHYDDVDEELGRIAIWHTHPSGLVGPSRGDHLYRHPDVPYLVVTLSPEGPIDEWF